MPFSNIVFLIFFAYINTAALELIQMNMPAVEAVVYLVTGPGEKMVDKQPDLLGDL